MIFKVMFFSFTVFLVTGCVDQIPAPIEYGGSVSNSISSKSLDNNFDNTPIRVKSLDNQDLEDKATGFLSAPEEDLIISPKPSSEGNVIYHEVLDGETLESIANNYDQSPDDIAAFNDIPYPCILDEHQLIKIKISNELLNKKNKEVNNKANFIKPVPGKVIIKFGDKTNYGPSKGINISAKEGEDVKSVTTGEVLFTGMSKQFGKLIVIRTASPDKNTDYDYQFFVYGHLKDTILQKGDIANKGEVIGHVGRSGEVSSPQLYFAIRENTNAVDPFKYIKFD